jgi:DNA repair protein SbcD/Mre11
MLRVAHTADWHASQPTKDECLKMAAFIYEVCAKQGVDLIINAGDIFDGAIVLGEKSPVSELLDLISGCKIPQIIIEGTKTHDIPGSVDIFGKIYANHIRVFRTPASMPLFLEKFGQAPCGHISLLPAPTKAFFSQKHDELSQDETGEAISDGLKSILASFGLAAMDSPRPHIVVSHITVTGSETSTGQVLLGGDIQVSVGDLGLAHADYIALGHIHKSQQPALPEHIRYAGSPYHLDFGELEDKGFNIVTFDDSGKLIDVEFVKTPSRPRQVIDGEIIDGKLVLSEPPYPGADIRVRIYGEPQFFHEGLTGEAEELCRSAASLKIESILAAKSRIRVASFAIAQPLRAEIEEYGKVKSYDITPSILAKADLLEEEAAHEPA